MTTTEIRVSSLKKSLACQANKKFAFETKPGQLGEAVVRSRIVKDTIKNALRYNLRSMTEVHKPNGSLDIPASEHAYSKAVMQYMSTRFDECGFINYQQKQEQLLWDHRRVMRYLLWEKRIPSFPEGETVLLGNTPVRVEPDVVFELNADTATVVFYRNGKPTITKTGKSSQFERELQLYAGILYARKKGYKNITSAIYFMKKASDHSSWNTCLQDFSGDNIMSMEDIYEEGTLNDLDAHMSELIALLESGIPSDMMAEKDCTACPHYDICRYSLPSVKGDEIEAQISAVPTKVEYTPQQQKVIDFDRGVARVIAAAGSGKTQTVAGRVTRMLKSGVKPEEILCITFSNAGAAEMKRKIAKDCLANGVQANIDDLKITTFHAFEFDIAKANWQKLGYKRNLTVIDTVQRFSIINQILKQHPIFEWGGKSFLHYSVANSLGERGALAIVADVFSQIKAMDGDESTPIDHIVWGDEIVDFVVKTEIVKRYKFYNEALHEKGLVDFDDMELNAFQIIDNDENYIKDNCAYKHIIIDEFQDTSAFQMELVKRLRRENPAFESMMIVGDDAQAIYGFRETSPEYIIDFESKLNEPMFYRTKNHSVDVASCNDDVVDLFLTSNWRSRQEILDTASELLKLNSNAIDKHVVASKGSGGKVVVQGYKLQKDEYEEIAKAVKAEHDVNGTSYDDIAILAYKKSELHKIADVLTSHGVPSMFGAPEPVSENSRIRALLSFAKVMDNPTDTKSAAIVANAVYRASDLTLTTGIMELDAADVQARVDAVVNKAQQIVGNPNPKEKKDEFIDFIKSFSLEDEVVEHFCEALEHLSFDEALKYCRDFERFGLSEEFRRLGDYPGVKLITAHSSKGLEWEVVFCTLDGLAKPFDAVNSAERDEIRRLEFVAMTRAKERLYVTGTFVRTTATAFATNRPLYELYSTTGREHEWVMADKYPTTSRFA